MLGYILCVLCVLHQHKVATASPTDDLAARWNIGEPKASYDKLLFTLDYEVSDFVEDSMFTYSVWKIDVCEDGGVTAEGPGLTSSKASVGSVGVGLGERHIKVGLQLHAPEVESEPIFRETNINGYRKGFVDVCVRVGLKTPDAQSPTEVNFLQTLVNIEIDYTKGFITNVNVAPAVDKLQVKMNYNASAYDCSPGETDPHGVGTLVRICVQPDPIAAGNGLVMKSVDFFTYSLNENPSVRQDAVVGGAAAPNGLTALGCTPGDSTCYISTILGAQFFAANTTVNATGQATMQYATTGGTSTRRRLGWLRNKVDSMISPPHRNLQLQEGASPDEEENLTSKIYVSFRVREDGNSLPLVSSWWYGAHDASLSPADIAIYALFILCVLSFTVLFLQLPRFQGSFLYL